MVAMRDGPGPTSDRASGGRRGPVLCTFSSRRPPSPVNPSRVHVGRGAPNVFGQKRYMYAALPRTDV
eukprot:scaffold223_cov408-Prasinococcus_capsulatus_cf.AAC.17